MKVHFNLAVSPAVDNMTEQEYQQAVVGLSVAVSTALKSVPNLNIDFTAGRSHVELHDVWEFHRKMMVPMSPIPAFLDKESHDFRFKFMQEELTEFQEGFEAGNLDKAFDSLLDLAYVVVGTALKMGLPWSSGWQRVHLANMTKRLAKPDGSDSKRGSPIDVVKPEGFQPPVHWHDLRIGPNQPAPIFNALAAVAHLSECRRTGAPLQAIQSFIEVPNDAPIEFPQEPEEPFKS